MPNAKLFDQGKHSDGTIKAAFEKNPQAWLFKERVLCKVRAVICGDCGFTELYTENSRVIYEAHQPPTVYDLRAEGPAYALTLHQNGAAQKAARIRD